MVGEASCCDTGSFFMGGKQEPRCFGSGGRRNRSFPRRSKEGTDFRREENGAHLAASAL